MAAADPFPAVIGDGQPQVGTLPLAEADKHAASLPDPCGEPPCVISAYRSWRAYHHHVDRVSECRHDSRPGIAGVRNQDQPVEIDAELATRGQADLWDTHDRPPQTGGGRAGEQGEDQ
jgi:hypothetical protein